MIQVLALFLISMGTAFANWTVIDSYLPVQCNDWGWVYNNIRTVWPNSCNPLSVKLNDRVVSLKSTEAVCKDNEAAYYVFANGSSWIDFKGCIPLSQVSK